ncbi:MAG TPA: histidine triad nucleotide-binding protein [Caldithrix abyssi]|uniref:Histidine triad nucleotide-binding protein n=1 Tax=Caldithrix abyssi TaxID=187145 RepID=A0A7V4U391_CALAY|nr:histidine triad nucleotide-binding protein [Caldithrix abyssi]
MERDDCIFCQVISGKLPSKMEYEDEYLAIFWDINPQAPTHLLIVPKKHVSRFSEFTDDDFDLMGKMMDAARKIALKLNLNEKGFRLVINEGRDSGQSIFHVHLHLLSGRRLMWPPG